MSGTSTIARLRAEIRHLEPGQRCSGAVLPFEVPALDAQLPGGGLALGALHEVLGGERGPPDEAAATLFTAGIAARTRGPVLWCLRQPDLFAPALAQAGLAPERVIHVEAPDEAALLNCLEEGLRHGGLGAVVGEVPKLSMKASRRLQLAAEGRDTLALALHRTPRPSGAAGQGPPSAATTRWRIAACPSVPLPVPGVGRARWRVELLRVRGGTGTELTLEACDATGRLDLPAGLADGSGAEGRRELAS
ncbi:ImuA family protein [Fodinicurvata fenggangensis]|uniref:ImuA family protein n=1 Tax=Fodinicurvata fenggangensis TaxID=1121830 RepID=UPI0004791B3D|nr:damage-inducible protein [Fodinicurvata fenggangensis]